MRSIIELVVAAIPTTPVVAELASVWLSVGDRSRAAGYTTQLSWWYTEPPPFSWRTSAAGGGLVITANSHVHGAGGLGARHLETGE